MSGLISKCFHSGGGKHSPHLLITFFSPVISPFFSLLFFHFLQTSFITLLIFSPFYIIHLSLLVLGVGSANCCNFPKLHQLWDVTHDKRKTQIFPSWCHLIIQISSQFSDYRANLSFNIWVFKLSQNIKRLWKEMTFYCCFEIPLRKNRVKYSSEPPCVTKTFVSKT